MEKDSEALSLLWYCLCGYSIIIIIVIVVVVVVVNHTRFSSPACSPLKGYSVLHYTSPLYFATNPFTRRKAVYLCSANGLALRFKPVQCIVHVIVIDGLTPDVATPLRMKGMDSQ